LPSIVLTLEKALSLSLLPARSTHAACRKKNHNPGQLNQAILSGRLGPAVKKGSGFCSLLRNQSVRVFPETP
jgi:hypothetical protein